MAHGSGWAISLCASTSDPSSTIPLVVVLSLLSEFVSCWLDKHCNDRDRSRLHLVGKWSEPFLAGSISLYFNKIIYVLQKISIALRDVGLWDRLQPSVIHNLVLILSPAVVCLCLYFIKADCSK